MTGIKRKYNTSDVNMLIAGKVVCANSIRNLAMIVASRPDMNLAFFNSFSTRIDKASKDILGLDPYKDLRPLTSMEKAKFDELINLLVSFHKEMIRGYRNAKGLLDANLRSLGFADNWKDVSQNGNQNKMVALLTMFDKNMTQELETQIYNHKVRPGIIAAIRSKIKPFIDINAEQEAAKPLVQELTQAEVVEFNEIFGTTEDICIVCWDLFKKDHVLRQEFSFQKIVKAMGNYHPRPKVPPIEPIV